MCKAHKELQTFKGLFLTAPLLRAGYTLRLPMGSGTPTFCLEKQEDLTFFDSRTDYKHAN